MDKIGLVVPAVFFFVGAYVLLASLSADETAQLFGGLVEFRAKFGILIGGIGLFAGVAIAIEMLTRKNKRAPLKNATPH